MKLQPHQISGVELLLRDNCQMICDEMGMGKTATVIVAVLKRNLFPILVVCPASLKLNWAEEFKKWGNIDTTIDDLTKDVCIINYERLQKYKYDILERGFKQIVFDECHVLKSDKSIRAKVALELSMAIPYKILMTGSPMLNRPIELWQQIEILGWQNRFVNKKRFLFDYCGGRMTEYGIEYQGFSNLEELRDKFMSMIIRREKKDMENQLPPKNVIEVPLLYCPQPPPRSFHDIEHFDRVAIKSKIELSIDFIRNKMSTGEQVVVFVHHKEVGKAINLAFPNASVIVGGQSVSERQKNKDDFQSGKTQIIICSLQASAVGLTLTSAHIAVFIEYPWSPTLLAQAQDRIHRLSQTKECFIYYLYAKGSIDEYRLNLNKSKETVINYVMNRS